MRPSGRKEDLNILPPTLEPLPRRSLTSTVLEEGECTTRIEDLDSFIVHLLRGPESGNSISRGGEGSHRRRSIGVKQELHVFHCRTMRQKKVDDKSHLWFP